MSLRRRIIIFGILLIGVICCVVSICVSAFTKDEHVHCYDDWVVVSNPTCINKGKRERFCSCGLKQESDIAELGHDIVSFEERLADCTNGGHKAYVKCLRCDYSTYEEIDPLGHDYGEWEQTKSATCTDYGQEVRVCSRNEEHKETRNTEKLNHTPTDWLTETAATCTENGFEYIKCSVCSIRLDERSVEKSGHSPSDWITDIKPQCGVVGERHKECIVCGENLETDSITALDHVFKMEYDENSHYLKCGSCQIVKDIQPHKWGDNDCELCDYDAGGIKGLGWLPASDGTYILSSAANVKEKEFEIPATHNGKSVTAIGESVFGGFIGESIIVPSCITGIGKGAFSGCGNLRELTVPFMGPDRGSQSHLGYFFGIEDIEDNLILMPVSLKTVIISDGIVSLSDNTFYNCTHIENIVLPSTVESIGASSFYYCTSLESVEFPSNLKKIGLGAFMGCSSLTSIEIPACVEEIGSYAFLGIVNISLIFNNKIGWSLYDNEIWEKDISESELSDENIRQTIDKYMKYTWKCETSSSAD
ncbi:MAG: leucine-rich repeat domain-containing protein [Clostridia bacterium]|nr:leucine-rich repeat domain-containing protein [Clostridia bacterium]